MNQRDDMKRTLMFEKHVGDGRHGRRQERKDDRWMHDMVPMDEPQRVYGV